MAARLPSHVWVAHVLAYCTLSEVCRVGGCSAELHACAADPAVLCRATLVFRSAKDPTGGAGLRHRLRNWVPSLLYPEQRAAGSDGAVTRLTPVGLGALLRDSRASLRTLEIDGGLQTCWVRRRLLPTVALLQSHSVRGLCRVTEGKLPGFAERERER